MKRVNATGILSGLLTGSLLVVGCTGDDTTAVDGTGDSGTAGTDGGPGTPDPTVADGSTGSGSADGSSTDGTPTAESSDGATDEESSGDDGPDPDPVDMFLEITNISGENVMTTAISPGVWLNHEQTAELILPEDMPRTGEGLEELGEDGDPTNLAASLKDNSGLLLSGVFDTPEGGDMPAVIAPGENYRVEFTAEAFSRLSMAMMLVGSNDQLIATGSPGIGMFAGGGQPLGVRDVTNLLRVWDVGSEVNQAPGQGPWQPANSGANIGAPEAGGVFPHNDSTRAIPLAADLVSVQVTSAQGKKADPDEFTVTITNISEARGTMVTPLSDLFWMTHNDEEALFAAGSTASAELELLAEDGDTSGLDGIFNAGVGGVGLASVEAGPFLDGDEISFTVNTSNVTPLLSFATMLVESNDAFLATPAAGIPLYDEGGMPRDNEDIEDDILRLLTVWDAGTEANETTGAGANQAARQPGANTGAADADDLVRIYADAGSDIEESLPAMLDVSIENDGGNDFVVTITNNSASTGFPAVFTPAFYMLHDNATPIFELGSDASPGLESLAEDGDASGLVGEWDGMAGVDTAAVYDLADNGMGMPTAGPLLPGEFYEFTVTATTDERFFSFASMLVPSNDTFVAFSSGGIALLSAGGAPLSDEAIAIAIQEELGAWDAGTEGNQAGAAGRDQAPRQAGPNTGEGNGSGLVRVHEQGPGNNVVWSAPQANQVVQVRLGPVER